MPVRVGALYIPQGCPCFSSLEIILQYGTDDLFQFHRFLYNEHHLGSQNSDKS
jgi:hypothetical protein